jgi:hypothetical protein
MYPRRTEAAIAERLKVSRFIMIRTHGIVSTYLADSTIRKIPNRTPKSKCIGLALGSLDDIVLRVKNKSGGVKGLQRGCYCRS